MTTATYNKFNSANTRLVTDCNVTTDTFKIMLTNTAPVATNDVIADIVEITGGNGYTAGGIDIDLTAVEVNSTVEIRPDGNKVVTASGGSIPAYRYFVLVDVTTDALISYWDRGSEIALADGDTSTITLGATVAILS